MKTFFTFLTTLINIFASVFIIFSLYAFFNIFYGDYNFCVNKKILNNNQQSTDYYLRAIEIPFFDSILENAQQSELPDTEPYLDTLTSMPIESLIDKSENFNFFIVDDVEKKIYLNPFSQDDKSYDYNLSGYTLNWSGPSVNWFNSPKSEEPPILYNEFNRVSRNLMVSNYNPSDQLLSVVEEYSCIKVDKYSYIIKLSNMAVRDLFQKANSPDNLDPDLPKE